MAVISFDIFAKDHASKEVSKVGKGFDGLHSKLAGFGAMAGTAILGATVAVGALGVAAATMGIKTAAALEQAQVGFTTLLGSGEKADAFLRSLQSFAASTPFELPGLIDASRTLLGVGVSAKEVIPMLTAFGDTAGAVGVGQDAFQRIMLATSQALSAGKFMAGDLNQIMTNGIPIWSILSKAMGKPVPVLRDMASKGKLLAKDVMPLLMAQMNKDYGGSMAKQSQTLSGLWSTLMDTINIGMANVMMPLLPVIKKLMPGAMKILGDALSNAAKGMQSFADRIGPILKTAKGYFDAFMTGLKGGSAGGSGPFVTLTNAGRALGEMFNTLKPIVMQAVGVLLQLGQSFATSLLPKLQAVSTLFSTVFLPIIKQVLAFVKSLLPAFAAIGAAIGGFIAAIMPSLQSLGQQIVAVLGPGLKSISAVIMGQVVPAFANFMSAIQPLVKFIISVVGPMVIDTLKGVIQFIKGAFQIIAGVLNAFSALFRGDWSALWKAVKQIGSGIWEAIKGAFKIFLNVGIGKIFGTGSKLITGIGKKMWTALKGLFESGQATVKGVVRSGIDAVVAFFKSLPGKAMSAVKSLLSTLKTFFVNVWKGASTATTTGISNAVKLVRSLPGKIKSAVGNLGRVLYNAGKQVIQGLINGITGMIGSLRKKLSSVTNMLPDWKGPARVDIKILEPAGRDVMSGFMNGIERQLPALRGLLSNVTGSLVPTGRPLSLADYKQGTPTPPMSVRPSATPTGPIQIVFSGPVGNQRELYDWLVKSFNDLSRQGRVSPATLRR